MPVAGRKPKSNPRHRIPPVHEWTEVADVPFAGAPRLPRSRLGGRPWPKRTRDWWRAVSTMPHAALWSDADWSFAIDTAMLAAEFHDGVVSAATELRQREKILGTTMDARRDLRIRYLHAGPPAEPEEADRAPAPVAQLDEYRTLYE